MSLRLLCSININIFFTSHILSLLRVCTAHQHAQMPCKSFFPVSLCLMAKLWKYSTNKYILVFWNLHSIAFRMHFGIFFAHLSNIVELSLCVFFSIKFPFSIYLNSSSSLRLFRAMHFASVPFLFLGLSLTFHTFYPKSDTAVGIFKTFYDTQYFSISVLLKVETKCLKPIAISLCKLCYSCFT